MDKRKRDMIRLIVLMSAAMLSVVAAEAATLRGSVLDAGTKEALIQASVRMLAPADSSLVKGAMTNNDGLFTIENVKAGKYILEVSYVGFSSAYQNITVGTENIRLKPIELSESTLMLREATVTGIRTPIKVMEDTIEFSAESYKTQPNAVVEDLLKRLPGVEVGTDGSITANGKSVSKILIDGKEFFSDDPTVASRNLPVDMIEKLQVVDRKSDLARITGVDDGEEETVINLTVKKDRNNGWFGTVEGGYGTDDRYKANVNINRFWNGNQITILGGANNINEPGFADGASRFMRFGGMNGITNSQAFGVNFNIGNEEIFRVGGNLMYSHTSRNTSTSSETQRFIGDSTSYESSRSKALDKGNNIRADFRIQWKPDSFNTLDIRPNISLNYNDSWSNDSSSTFAGDLARSLVTRSLNEASSKGNAFSAGLSLIYNHSFKQRKGRSFSIFTRFNTSNQREKSDTYSWNKFFLLNDSIDLYDQYTDNHTWNNNFSTRLSWTEPLGNVKNGNFLTLAYNFSYRWNNADKMVYDHPVEFPDGWGSEPVIDPTQVFNDNLSNRFRNTYMSQDIRLGFRHVDANTNLNVGLSLLPQSSQSTNLINSDKNIPRRNVLNVAPFLRYRYRASKTRSITVDYNGRTQQPSMSQLQPVADMSNPLRIVIGNPELVPSFTHSLNLRFQDFNPDAQRSIMAMVFANFQQNSIVSKTTYNNETGGQTTTYDNVNGVWSIRGMNMISLPFKNRSFTFNNNLFLNYNNSVGFIDGTRNRSGSFMVGESFGIAYRPENLEFELRPNYNLQSISNSVQSRSNSNRTTHSYGASFYATYTTPIDIILNTDLNFSATSGYSDGYDTRTWMWNASVSYQFLRGKSGTLTLRAYDLLGQRSNVRRSSSAMMIQDARYNSLTRYFMITFSYKFNTFAKGQDPQGMDGGIPGGSGGRRQGPPAGGGRPRF